VSERDEVAEAREAVLDHMAFKSTIAEKHAAVDTLIAAAERRGMERAAKVADGVKHEDEASAARALGPRSRDTHLATAATASIIAAEIRQEASK
jgi:hypothetical protein